MVNLRYGDDIIDACDGQTVLDAILRAGFDHRHICGGNGFCTSCRVEVMANKDGLSPVSRLEKDRLGSDAGRLRLACQARIQGPVHVRIPPFGQSRFPPDYDKK